MSTAVMLNAGKVLLVDGKVAVDPNCCCGEKCAVTLDIKRTFIVLRICGYVVGVDPDRAMYATKTTVFTTEGFGYTGSVTQVCKFDAPRVIYVNPAEHPPGPDECIESRECEGEITFLGAPVATCDDYNCGSTGGAETFSDLIDSASEFAAWIDDNSRYPAYQDVSGNAFKDSDFANISVQRILYTIEVDPITATADWDIVFTPAGGGAPTTTHRSQLGGIVEEIIPTSGDPDGTWSVENVTCHT